MKKSIWSRERGLSAWPKARIKDYRGPHCCVTITLWHSWIPQLVNRPIQIHRIHKPDYDFTHCSPLDKAGLMAEVCLLVQSAGLGCRFPDWLHYSSLCTFRRIKDKWVTLYIFNWWIKFWPQDRANFVIFINSCATFIYHFVYALNAFHVYMFDCQVSICVWTFLLIFLWLFLIAWFLIFYFVSFRFCFIS